MSTVQEAAAVELGKDVVKETSAFEAALVGDRVRELLGRSLTADAAVQIALLNNQGLQASYSELGISEAQYVQASLPPNPTVLLQKTVAPNGFAFTEAVIGNLFALLTLPARRDIAETQFQAAQLRAIEATLRLTADVRRQYWRAIAAQELVRLLNEARGSAEVSADLAKALGQSGGMNKLDQSREFAFYAEISGRLADARVQEKVEHERLARLMGLWDRASIYTLPARLPALPAKLTSSSLIEALAMERRVDLRLARANLEIFAKTLGLTHATRYINALALGPLRDYEKTGASERANRYGLQITFEIPIYDFGEARTREAQETYMQAAHLLAGKAVNVRSEVREAFIAYKGAFEVARLYQAQVEPLQSEILKQSLLQTSTGQTDVFVLVQDARNRILAQATALNARREFWIADTDLRAAIIGGGMAGRSDGAGAAVSGSDG
ncbi:MAG: TolC family protein [Pseudomonadota bacterium]|nr:TolC family protein [Pseudomonadota bacterium]